MLSSHMGSRVPGYLIRTRTHHTTHEMEALARMVEKKLEATKVELFTEFQEILGSVLLDVSRKYDIKFEDLESEYLTSSGSASSSEGESPVKVKAKPRVRKAKATEEERKKCSAKTAKGAPCKNFALAGCEFCACHSKAKGPAKPSKVQKMRKEGKKGTVKPVSPPSSDEIDSDAESVRSPVKPTKRPTKAKKAQVVHDHAIDHEVHEECAACEVLGGICENPAVMVDEDVKKVLDELFNGSDVDEADDSGSETEGDE